MSRFQPEDPEYRSRVREILDAAHFIRHLGIELDEFGPGWCETKLVVRPEHLQQNQLIHAGVQATMADHTAGAAAGSLMRNDQIVLTVEFKIHLLRPARADVLRCRADVIRPGRKVTIVESRVFPEGREDRPVSQLIATMALVDAAGG